MITIAGAGHRPDKLGELWSPTRWTPAVKLIKARLHAYNRPLRVISGMMVGFDLMLAEACVELKAEGHPIRLVAALAYDGQEAAWHHDAIDYYKRLLGLADEVYAMAPSPAREAFELRNRWMIAEADAILACWDGSYGGTGMTIQQAQEAGKPVVNLYPDIQQALGF